MTAYDLITVGRAHDSDIHIDHNENDCFSGPHSFPDITSVLWSIDMHL